jgi:hypothetical protein
VEQGGWLLTDGLPTGGGKGDEQDGVLATGIRGIVPGIGGDGDGISREHEGNATIGYRVADLPVDDDEDFGAIGMVVGGIALPGFYQAAAHG